MNAPGQPTWSRAVGEADWIRASLAPSGSFQVTSVVPGGFPAYARLLHPAQEPTEWGDRLVRWAEVAAWSGRPLRDDAQFHSVALPPDRPVGAAPWSGQGPRAGRLSLPDAEVLAGILRDWTAAPEACWFCVWDGYGWDGVALLAADGGPGLRLPDPVPGPVRQGPRVRLPHRDYFLYAGPVEAVTAVAPLSGDDQTANLWWPADRAWCVASEIDLAWTYVAGPDGLIRALLAESRLEALPARPGDPPTRTEDWVSEWADQAAESLLATGEATVTTSRGTLRARLVRPGRWSSGALTVDSQGDNGVSGSGSARLGRGSEQDLREEIRLRLTMDIIGLVGG